MDNSLKALERTDEAIRVGNYIVLYGDESKTDLVGEWFTKSTALKSAYTELGKFPVDWEHGFYEADGEPGREALGYVDWSTLKADERGAFVTRVLDRRHRHVQLLDEAGLFDNGALGTSSEADPLRVQIEDTGEIKTWPLIKDTLTVAPMEPRMLSENQLQAVKTLANDLPGLKALMPEGDKESPADVQPAAVDNIKSSLDEGDKMTEKVEPKEAPAVDEDAIVAKLMKAMDDRQREANKAAKPDNDPGPAAVKAVPVVQGGPDNENVAIARWVRTGDVGAIKAVNAGKAANDQIMTTATGADGEYAVPDTQTNMIMAKAGETWLAPRLGVTELPAGPGKTAYAPFDNEADVVFYAGTEQIDDYSNVFTRNIPAIGQATLTMARRDMSIPLTIELIEWEDAQLIPFINNYIGRAFAKDQNGLLVTEVAANGTAYTLSSASALATADIPGIVWALPEGYEQNAQWIMRKATAGSIYSLQGDSFVFKGTPAGAGTPEGPMLEFAPVNFSANVAAVAASAKSLLYGDFSRVGYRNSGLRFQRNPYKHQGIVYLEYHYWAVYDVMIAEAVRVGTHPSA